MFRSISALLLVICCSLSANADIFLGIGDSVTKNGETIHCGPNNGGGHGHGNQSATEKTCQKYSSWDSTCISWNEKTITGRFCAEGRVCQKYSSWDGTCISYNQTAACGNLGCTVSKECKKNSSWDGTCISYDSVANCQ